MRLLPLWCKMRFFRDMLHSDLEGEDTSKQLTANSQKLKAKKKRVACERLSFCSLQLKEGGEGAAGVFVVDGGCGLTHRVHAPHGVAHIDSAHGELRGEDVA